MVKEIRKSPGGKRGEMLFCSHPLEGSRATIPFFSDQHMFFYKHNLSDEFYASFVYFCFVDFITDLEATGAEIIA